MISSNPPCVHQDTKILTSNGIKPIKEIISGDKVYDGQNELVEVINNMEFIPSKEFILVKKDAFEINSPDQDLYIRKGHPFSLHGQEINCEKLINGTTVKNIILDKRVSVYSLLTKNRTPVMMQGVPTYTWGEEDWDTVCSKRRIIHWDH